jgi:hypothetical protein
MQEGMSALRPKIGSLKGARAYPLKAGGGHYAAALRELLMLLRLWEGSSRGG